MNQACEIRLEDLLNTQYLVKNLKLKNNRNAKLLAADNLTRNIGRGMEYAESRIYQPGDDVRHIDWRITARHGKTYTKLYHEEKGENNYIILDLSNSLYFGTKHYLKSVTASKAASFIAWLGFYEHNNIGGLVFNDTQIEYTQAKLTKNNIIHFLNCINKLHQPNSINKTNKPDFNLFSALKKYEHVLHKNSRIFIISDFLNIDDLFYKKLQQLNHHNLITLIKISDPIEKEKLAPGVYDISNGINSTNITINSSNQYLFKKFFDEKLSIYNKIITKLNIRNIEIFTNPDWYYNLINKI